MTHPIPDEAPSPAAVARKLSPTQLHCLLRFSDAEEWDHSGYGMPRIWSDLVYGRKGAQHRSLMGLVHLGIAEPVERPHGAFRLTPFSMSVQLHARMKKRGL